MISGVFLTDLRGREGRAYPRTAPAIAAKYPGADLLVTVVTEGKVILPPRALRLKLPPDVRISDDTFLDSFVLSSDGMRLSGLLWHGELLNDAYTTHMDICVLGSPGGRMRRLSCDTFFGFAPMEWSPNHRQIAAVEIVDKPPVPYDTRSNRLVVFDTRTGTAHTLSERMTRKNGTFERFLWATSKTGERGVAFRVRDANGLLPDPTVGEAEKNRTWAWFFVPVPPAIGDAKPGAMRQIAESDLPDYGIILFPATVVEAQKTLRFNLSLSSPRGDMAVFYRDDGGLLPVDDAGPEGLYTPWIPFEAGRRAVIDKTGKTLLNRDEKKLVVYDWTWDGLLLTSMGDKLPFGQYLAWNPRTGTTRKATIPAQVPYPWQQWLQLSPAAAHRAAKYWRQTPTQ